MGINSWQIEIENEMEDLMMRVVIRRHTEYSKHFVTIENGINSKEFVLYDMNVSEVAEFVKGLMF